MSQCVDYGIRVEGSFEALDLAKAEIAKFQEDMNEVSGNGSCDFGSSPDQAGEGAFTWHCFADNGVIYGLEQKLYLSAIASGAKVWVCASTTDGENWASLSIFDPASERKNPTDYKRLGEWKAAFGLSVAMAIHRLASEASAADIMRLIERIELAREDGWDEESCEWLVTAGVVAGEAFKAFSAHAGLLEDGQAAAALAALLPTLREARADLRAMLGFKPKQLSSIDGLIAMSEGVAIKSGMQPLSKGKSKASKVRI